MTRILLAPAAGQRSDAPWMIGWRRRLEALAPVAIVDWPYVAAGRRRPDPLPVLVAALIAAVPPGEGPLLLVGKSMGSRISCIAAEPVGACGVVAFGYPLVPASGKVAEREAVLRAVRAPVLFVAGTRDPMGPLDHLERIRGEMAAPTELLRVETGDHGLRVLRRSGVTQDQSDAAIFERIAAFTRRVAG
jgi:predicted alpha/beta-hydrolase family hydrolase